jgi:hypothetical protein
MFHNPPQARAFKARAFSCCTPWDAFGTPDSVTFLQIKERSNQKQSGFGTGSSRRQAMVQARRVYVIQVWYEGKHLVVRLSGQHLSEPKHFRSWAALLLYLNTNVPQRSEKMD